MVNRDRNKLVTHVFDQHSISFLSEAYVQIAFRVRTENTIPDTCAESKPVPYIEFLRMVYI